MYQFKSTDQTEALAICGKMTNITLFPEYNEVKIYGILRKLFGEPHYETDDFKNAYEYIIQATDKSVGSTIYFCVYHGATGCAIGSCERTTDTIQAVSEFMELLKATEPADFMYEGIYMDALVKIRYGIQNGQIIYEESYLEDDE